MAKDYLGLVLAEFKRQGILLESDRCLPSVASLVAGGPMKGSWWGHKKGREIWRVLNELASRDDALVVKLVSGKVTFVHRSLWRYLLSVSTSGESWQTESLSRDAMALLEDVRQGEVDTSKANGRIKKPEAEAARQLERRLLVQSEAFHTPRGFHAKKLRTWRSWSRKVGFKERLPPVGVAKSKIEGVVAALNSRHGCDGRLPWELGH